MPQMIEAAFVELIERIAKQKKSPRTGESGRGAKSREE
jgi:hypothetical protein